MYAIDDDALANELLADEVAHLLRADPGDQRRLQAESRRADGDIGGAAADGFGEASDVLEPTADLLAIEIDRRTADGDQVKHLFHGLAVLCPLLVVLADAGRAGMRACRGPARTYRSCVLPSAPRRPRRAPPAHPRPTN
jgi:hypothetical protein